MATGIQNSLDQTRSNLIGKLSSQRCPMRASHTSCSSTSDGCRIFDTRLSRLTCISIFAMGDPIHACLPLPRPRRLFSLQHCCFYDIATLARLAAGQRLDPGERQHVIEHLESNSIEIEVMLHQYRYGRSGTTSD